jgi:hypothetical protein
VRRRSPASATSNAGRPWAATMTPDRPHRARPERGVNPEEREHANQQRLHELRCVEEQRVARAVVPVRVRSHFAKPIGARVALPARRHETRRGNRGADIVLENGAEPAIARRDTHEPELLGRGTCHETRFDSGWHDPVASTCVFHIAPRSADLRAEWQLTHTASGRSLPPRRQHPDR